MKFSNPFPNQCAFSCHPINEDLSTLHPKEIEITKRFNSEPRKKEFITGRQCAQQAMQTLGTPRLPVLQNSNRSPAWPFSIVGSISHGAGLAAAVICKQNSGIIGVGLDVEDLSREIKTNITSHVLTKWEIAEYLDGKEEVSRAVRIIFSIKEAIYKCLFPIGGIYLGFGDAEVEVLSDSSFTARLLRSPLKRTLNQPLRLHGIIEIQQQVVMAATKVAFEDFEPV